MKFPNGNTSYIHNYYPATKRTVQSKLKQKILDSILHKISNDETYLYHTLYYFVVDRSLMVNGVPNICVEEKREAL